MIFSVLKSIYFILIIVYQYNHLTDCIFPEGTVCTYCTQVQCVPISTTGRTRHEPHRSCQIYCIYWRIKLDMCDECVYV
jgi:hypothetical protein